MFPQVPGNNEDSEMVVDSYNQLSGSDDVLSSYASNVRGACSGGGDVGSGDEGLVCGEGRSGTNDDMCDEYAHFKESEYELKDVVKEGHDKAERNSPHSSGRGARVYRQAALRIPDPRQAVFDPGLFARRRPVYAP